ncbi:unnamed protein product [Cochlearia groenlandica]
MKTMKQLHKQMSSKRDDDTIPMSQSIPYSPKAMKHPRSLPRSIHYLFREQRLLFILVGILIGSTFFILQPSLSRLGAAESTSLITRSVSTAAVDTYSHHHHKMSFNYGDGRGKTGRVPVDIGRRRLTIVVTGGAGFVGSHLVDKLIGRGDEVIVIDNLFTGRKENLVHLFSNPRFELIRHNVVDPILLEVDQIYHLACPASPVHYKFLLTSTSEVYGDPLEHPQKETYWGNVNPIGERSCYDEGKRTAETLAMDYHRGAGVEVRIARIFNTYGPRMCLDDGRVVSNFVAHV